MTLAETGHHISAESFFLLQVIGVLGEPRVDASDAEHSQTSGVNRNAQHADEGR